MLGTVRKQHVKKEGATPSSPFPQLRSSRGMWHPQEPTADTRLKPRALGTGDRARKGHLQSDRRASSRASKLRHCHLKTTLAQSSLAWATTFSKPFLKGPNTILGFLGQGAKSKTVVTTQKRKTLFFVDGL